jgi:hypothetical protein
MIQVFYPPCDPAHCLALKYWHYFTLSKWRLPFPLINTILFRSAFYSDENKILYMPSQVQNHQERTLDHLPQNEQLGTRDRPQAWKPNSTSISK